MTDQYINWAYKAKSIRIKYEKNKRVIIKELLRLHHSHNYNSKEVLIMLYLLSKIIKSELDLHRIFINGIEHYMALTKDEKLESFFHEVFSLEVGYEKAINGERMILSNLSSEFNHLDGHINLKEIEGGIFFTHINENHLQILSQRLLNFIPNHEEHIIRKIHSEVLHCNKITFRREGKIKSGVKHLVHHANNIFIEAKQKNIMANFARAAFFMTFIATMFGMDEEISANIRTLTRTMML